jgi:hypothetical protein
MKQVKEERKYLENIREELIKKVDKLFEQNKSKRYHGKVYYPDFIAINKTNPKFYKLIQHKLELQLIFKISLVIV